MKAVSKLVKGTQNRNGTSKLHTLGNVRSSIGERLSGMEYV